MERQRKGEALQGDKTNCFKDTADRNEAINYYNKCPLLVILPHFLVIIIIHSVITHAGVTLAEGPASRECYKSSEDEVGGYEDLKKKKFAMRCKGVIPQYLSMVLWPVNR